jgi:CBS domain-containing protein
MVVRDILNMKGGAVYSTPPDATVAAAVGLMVRHDIGSLVVVEGERMTGMLTFREVLNALDAGRGNLADMRVNEVMVRNPLCGSPADTLDQAREVMTRNHIRYLPITEGERLLGVMSFHDIAKAVINETNCENRLLKRYIEKRPEADDAAH